MSIFKKITDQMQSFLKWFANFFDGETKTEQQTAQKVVKTDQKAIEPVADPKETPKSNAQSIDSMASENEHVSSANSMTAQSQINSFTRQINRQIHNKKLHNVSLKEIPSPGVIINTDLYNHKQQAIQIYAYNQNNYQIEITDDGNILSYVEERNPDLEIDEQSLSQTGIRINHEYPEALYIRTDLNHFAKDLKTFIKVSSMMIG